MESFTQINGEILRPSCDFTWENDKITKLEVGQTK